MGHFNRTLRTFRRFRPFASCLPFMSDREIIAELIKRANIMAQGA